MITLTNEANTITLNLIRTTLISFLDSKSSVSTFWLLKSTFHKFSILVESSNERKVANSPNIIFKILVLNFYSDQMLFCVWLYDQKLLSNLIKICLINFRVIHYCHKWLTKDQFDNHYITHHVREIEFKRFLDKKETIFPLHQSERFKYIALSSILLVKSEKKSCRKQLFFFW